MFYIIWKNYDDYYREEFTEHIGLATRLLDISKKVEKGDYGEEIITVVSGEEVHFEYKIDKVNNEEKLLLWGDVVITKVLLKAEETKRTKIRCPTCGSASKKSGCISPFLKVECSTLSRSTLDRYKCSACSKEFYI